MNRKLFAITVLIALAGVAVLYAQNKDVKLTGNLIDNACSSAHVKDKDFANTVANHTTSCALMAACKGSGYAVYADSKLYKLDEAGSKLAQGIREDTKTEKGVRVAVEEYPTVWAHLSFVPLEEPTTDDFRCLRLGRHHDGFAHSI
jgi:hypothetical protein